jgi:hypothetical protein
VSFCGFLRFPNGQVKMLHAVGDAEWVEGWLRRSVAPRTLWHLTTPLLPIGEALATPMGTTVPIAGLDADGHFVAVLFDLHPDRPFTQILGDGLGVLQWAEQLDERQIEAFARYFWHDTTVSLRAVWEQLYATALATPLGAARKVHILSWRPHGVLSEMQQFLLRQKLAMWLFRLFVLQGDDGEVIAFAEPVIGAASTGEKVGPSAQRLGGGEPFLQSLLEQPS